MSRKSMIVDLAQVLAKRRDALRRALAGDVAALERKKWIPPGDVVDGAADSVEDEVASELVEVESRELARVEHSMEQMREGRYGVCEACGSNIPLARLNALPYATLCIRCQREVEQRQSAPIDAGLVEPDLELDLEAP